MPHLRTLAVLSNTTHPGEQLEYDATGRTAEAFALRLVDAPFALGADVDAVLERMRGLATNAVKYGALSNGTGQIGVHWTVVDTGTPSRLCLTWEEAEGPPVQKPARRGFGTRLIERSLAQELGGEVRIDFSPTGVICSVNAPLMS